MENLKSIVNLLKDRNYNVKKAGEKIKNISMMVFLTVIIVGISFVIISPIIKLISESIMDISDFYNPLVYIIPQNFTSFNFTKAIEKLDYFNVEIYTILFSGLIMIIQTAVCSVTGYGFARFKFTGSKILFGLVILTIVIPIQTFMVPLYIQFRYFDFLGIGKLLGSDGINMIGTSLPLLLMSLTGMGIRSGLFIYIFRQFYKGLPKAIEEAALIDGAGPFRTYFTVMLPNAVPSVITVMLFSFVWQYNDLFFSSVLMSNSNLISIKITTLASTLAQGSNPIRDPNLVSLVLHSGILLTIAPLIILYLFIQRYFMEGIERSGIVG